MFDLPPVIYDHVPATPYTVQRMIASEVEGACQTLGAVPGSLACAWRTKIGCTVIMPVVGPGGVTQRSFDIFLRHEFGHCNGWPSNHGGAR